MSEIIEADDDGEVLDESTIDVKVNDGVRPPADVVKFAEDHAGIHTLITGTYPTTGNVRMVLVSTIGVALHDLPDDWRAFRAGTKPNGDLTITLKLQ
jgi:hypothetical protein